METNIRTLNFWTRGRKSQGTEIIQLIYLKKKLVLVYINIFLACCPCKQMPEKDWIAYFSLNMRIVFFATI